MEAGAQKSQSHCHTIVHLLKWQSWDLSPGPFLLSPSDFCLSVHGTSSAPWFPAYPFMCVFLPCSPQGMAFTLEERLQLGIHGLIPPCFLSQDVQLLRIMRYYERQQSDLDKSVPKVCSLYPSPGLSWLFPVVYRGFFGILSS